MMQVSRGVECGQDRVIGRLHNTDPYCPHDGCGEKIDPSKMLCYSFLQVAYGVGDASEEVEDELEDEEDTSGSDSEEETTESDSDFIVDDDDDLEDEEENEDEDEYEGKRTGHGETRCRCSRAFGEDKEYV